MRQDLIFAPMGALAFLTLFVLSFVPLRRFQAGFAGLTTPDDYKYGESTAVPGHVAIPNRNYMSLLEGPLLFYVASILYFVAARVDQTVLIVAWTYVALRFVHSAIHMTYNRVLHRLIPFALSSFTLTAYWVLFFVKAPH
jgi:hypothetical protein